MSERRERILEPPKRMACAALAAYLTIHDDITNKNILLDRSDSTRFACSPLTEVSEFNYPFSKGRKIFSIFTSFIYLKIFT